MSQEEQESRKLILSEDDEDDYLPNDQNEKDLDDHDSFSQSSSTRVGFRKSTDPNDTIIDAEDIETEPVAKKKEDLIVNIMKL